MKNLEIDIPLTSVTLKGDLVIPENPVGIIVFSNGRGSSRLSVRNKLIAETFQKHRIGTLLFDLLTPAEDEIYQNRFNIDLLVGRLIETTEWLMKNPYSKNTSIGYFGISNGSASALRAAAYFGKLIKSVVSKGGRPDLALGVLHQVSAPTLLIVGEKDTPMIENNKIAFDELESIKEMKIVKGATQLFEEPGTLSEVANLAVIWYKKHLVKNKELVF